MIYSQLPMDSLSALGGFLGSFYSFADNSWVSDFSSFSSVPQSWLMVKNVVFLPLIKIQSVIILCFPTRSADDSVGEIWRLSISGGLSNHQTAGEGLWFHFVGRPSILSVTPQSRRLWVNDFLILGWKKIRKIEFWNYRLSW